MTKPLYLVAVDGSEWSERAVERAINLAITSKARVKLVTAMDWSYLPPMVIEGSPPPLLDRNTEEQNTISRVLTPLIAKYGDKDVELKSELVWGDPTEVILEMVKSEHANMLFVGRQGRSRVIDLLIGSVANKLAHRIGIPLVLVP